MGEGSSESSSPSLLLPSSPPSSAIIEIDLVPRASPEKEETPVSYPSKIRRRASSTRKRIPTPIKRE